MVAKRVLSLFDFVRIQRIKKDLIIKKIINCSIDYQKKLSFYL